jgi:adenylate cyclase
MLSRLLQYLVERTVGGQTDGLKEYCVGVEVFERGSSFDPRTDTIVRVQVRRLRSKLREYYQNEGRADPILIDLPKGHYLIEWRSADPRLAVAGPAGEDPPAPAAREDPSIVVLPFVNLSSDPEDEYFSDGLTEEIISALASVANLRVVARTSAFQFKGRCDDIRRIGRDLGARTALEGSVRKEGRTVRIAVQLVDTANGLHLWSQVLERELTSILKIQDEITRAIVSVLRIRLTSETTGTADTPVVPHPEAYDLYLKSRHYYHKMTLAGAEKCVECLGRAISLDPRYATAYAGLADAYVMWMSLASNDGPNVLLQKARHAAQRAVELEESAETRCSMGEVLSVCDWNFAAAEQQFLRALNLKPSFVHARVAYGVTCLAPLRRHEEAVAQLRRALAADRMSILLRTLLGQALVLAGQPDAAVDELRQVLELEPEYVFATFTLAFAYLAQSAYAEALEVLNQIPEASEEYGNYAGHLGYAHARLGNRADARYVLKRLERRSWAPAVDVAAIYSGLGDSRNATKWVERARRARHFDSLFVIDDPRFRNLLSNPQFLAALSI